MKEEAKLEEVEGVLKEKGDTGGKGEDLQKDRGQPFWLLRYGKMPMTKGKGNNYCHYVAILSFLVVNFSMSQQCWTRGL